MALIMCLAADLDLAFMILRTLEIEEKYDPEKAPALLANVRQALRTIRQFTGKIQNRDAWQRIHSRADELEARIAKVFG